MMNDEKHWIGHRVEAVEIAEAAPQFRLAALLDRPPPSNRLVPPLGHWLYFLPDAPQSELGTDGHPARGKDLPGDPDLPRRMWAGGRIEFLAQIGFGTELHRCTTVVDVKRTDGRSGPLMFVTLDHEILCDGALAIRERQDLVYRGMPAPQAASPASSAPADLPAPSHMQRFAPDSSALFRYSALTFNAHRIHYDLAYARDVEAYPGLIVQGPYQATALMNHMRLSLTDRAIDWFEFRAGRPLFCGEDAMLCLHGDRLWVRGADGTPCMRARFG
jgi:3-methylfumaryl-CoA hydratase